ncbi:MAG TPA: isoprenylcysteine carboxylmethyltransferase family protein [Patescibacteria group bacterium]
MDYFLRITTLGFFVLWQVYWLITEKRADQEKPKRQSASRNSHLQRNGLNLLCVVVLVQVLGVSFLPVNFPSQEVGICLVMLGTALGISARKTLGTNWAHAAEYQIKQQQTLVTQGVYKYIRNPIYIGLTLSLVGAELVAKSYLFLVLLVLGFGASYLQAKREEKILEMHFAKEYRDYKKRSKMLIPFLF